MKYLSITGFILFESISRDEGPQIVRPSSPFRENIEDRKVILQGGTSKGVLREGGYLAWLEMGRGRGNPLEVGGPFCGSHIQLNFSFGPHFLGRGFGLKNDLARI